MAHDHVIRAVPTHGTVVHQCAQRLRCTYTLFALATSHAHEMFLHIVLERPVRIGLYPWASPRC
jgi:hypothetical protein